MAQMIHRFYSACAEEESCYSNCKIKLTVVFGLDDEVTPAPLFFAFPSMFSHVCYNNCRYLLFSSSLPHLKGNVTCLTFSSSSPPLSLSSFSTCALQKGTVMPVIQCKQEDLSKAVYSMTALQIFQCNFLVYKVSRSVFKLLELMRNIAQFFQQEKELLVILVILRKHACLRADVKQKIFCVAMHNSHWFLPYPLCFLSESTFLLTVLVIWCSLYAWCAYIASLYLCVSKPFR